MNYITPDLIFYHSLVVFGSLLVVFVLVHMLYHRRSSSSIVAWILFILLVPYIAVFMYLIIGSRKRENRYKKQKITQKNISRCSEFKLFFDAIASYNEFLDSINNAKKSIYISVYVFNHDKTTEKIIKTLTKKAKEGVDIKILIDSLGSIMLYLFDSKLKELRDAGAKIEFFMPIFKMPFRNYINLRNHRKIFIFDNEKVLSGGLNLSNEYIGAKKDKTRWEDIMFLLKGEIVEHFFDIFASDWFYASDEHLEFIQQTRTPNEGADISLQVVPSGPDMSRDVLYEMLLSSIYGAKKKIYIVTPYFIPNSALIQSLIIAKHRGVDVVLITPKESNHPIVNLVRSSYMRELEEANINVYLYEDAMLHAKAILFDDECVVLGSANFDNRSLFLNYEVATFVYNDKIIKEVDMWVDNLISKSSSGTSESSYTRRVFENLTKILAPQL